MQIILTCRSWICVLKLNNVDFIQILYGKFLFANILKNKITLKLSINVQWIILKTKYFSVPKNEKSIFKNNWNKYVYVAN